MFVAIPRGKIIQDDYVCHSLTKQPADDVAADEPGAAGHQDFPHAFHRSEDRIIGLLQFRSRVRCGTVSAILNRFLTHRPSREALAVGLFIGAVFYGDVFLGITVPVAILLLPLILILRMPTLTRTRWSVPVGFVLLSCTAVPVLIQMLGGYGPRGKSDLVIYLPFVYAGLTMLTLAGWRVADAYLHRSLLAGGVLCTVLLAGTLLSRWSLVLLRAGAESFPGA